MKAALIAASLVLFALSSCDVLQSQPLIGKWRAESFDLQSVKVPVGPELEFTENALLVSGETLPIEKYEKEDQAVTVLLRSGIELVFVLETKNRMFFTVPIVGAKIYYNRE